MDYRYLGRQVRYFRRKQSWTQEELAEIIGCSTSFVGHIERGTRKASMETILRISHALGVSIDRLVSPVLLQTSLYTREQLDGVVELLEMALEICKR